VFGGVVVSVCIDYVVIFGMFSFDGEMFDVDNNVWVFGDDDECVIIDVLYDFEVIMVFVGGCCVVVVLCIYVYDDYVVVVLGFGECVGVLVMLYYDDFGFWMLIYFDIVLNVMLYDG